MKPDVPSELAGVTGSNASDQDGAASPLRPSLGFLDLPREIRDMIYRELLIVDPWSVQRIPNNWDTDPRILRTNKQINREGREILRSENCFLTLEVRGSGKDVRQFKENASWRIGSGPMRTSQGTKGSSWPPTTADLQLNVAMRTEQIEFWLLSLAHLSRLEGVLSKLSTQFRHLDVQLGAWSECDIRDMWPQILSGLSSVRGLKFLSVYGSDCLDLLPSEVEKYYATMKSGDLERLMCSPISMAGIIQRMLDSDAEVEVWLISDDKEGERLRHLQKLMYLDGILGHAEDVFLVRTLLTNSPIGHLKLRTHWLSAMKRIVELSTILREPEIVCSMLDHFRYSIPILNWKFHRIAPFELPKNDKCKYYHDVGHAYVAQGRLNIALSCLFEAVILRTGSEDHVLLLDSIKEQLQDQKDEQDRALANMNIKNVIGPMMDDLARDLEDQTDDPARDRRIWNWRQRFCAASMEVLTSYKSRHVSNIVIHEIESTDC